MSLNHLPGNPGDPGEPGSPFCPLKPNPVMLPITEIFSCLKSGLHTQIK